MGGDVAEVDAWIADNPMWIHIPIGMCLLAFIVWWMWLVFRLGFAFAVLKIRRRKFLFVGVLCLATIWGLYFSSRFESTPIYWL